MPPIPDPPLQPCPFCGAPARMEKPWFTNEMVYISCSTPEAVNQKGMCPIAGIRFTTYPELWNHRAADDTEVF